MKTISLLSCLLCCVGISGAATPKMWVKDAGGRVPLRIDHINAEVTITGEMAETVLTLRFKNETPRFQEGEFVMPLPIGSTVSQYALEVNGALRDSVAVEKKQARHAYETIKSRKIDPGLVEREANNTYRTRVYPIPGNGTKLVRIGYIERIARKDGKLNYTLPTDYPGEVDQFSCTIRHDQIEGRTVTVNHKELKFEKDKQGEFYTAAMKKKLSGSISVSLTPVRGPQLSIEKHPGPSYFQLGFSRSSDAIEKPRKNIRHINLIWDASASCRGRDFSKEFKLLDFYFKHLKNVKVSLQYLRNTLHDGGEYQIQQGNWQALRQRLEGTFYDGSSAFEKIAKSQKRADLMLLVTDGQGSEHLKIQASTPAIILHQSNNQRLKKLAVWSHGDAIDLQQMKLIPALRKLTHTRFRVSAVNAIIGKAVLPADLTDSKRLNIVGTTYGNNSGVFTVTYKNGNRETIQQHLHPTSQHTVVSDSSHIVKRHWAQQKLFELEREAAHHSVIIKHCRKYGLVSDYTSLIVLERFWDYVNFDIPPPEPDLRQRWQAAKRNPSPSRSLKRQVHHVWRDRLYWNRRSYSWLPIGLLAKHQQTKIWLKAVETAFDKHDLNAPSMAVIENWEKKASAYIRKQNEIRDNSELQQWIAHHNVIAKEWLAFKDLKINPQKGQPIAVSVRGLVSNPQTYRAKTPLTLKSTIQLAGGLHSQGSLSSVSLYRHAHAVTYNIASKDFKDLTLWPGDMIVVGPEPYHDEDGFGADDPFGGEVSEPVDPTTKPAVSSYTPGVSPDFVQAQLFGDDDAAPFGGAPGIRNTDNTPPVTKPVATKPVKKITADDWQRFETTIAGGNQIEAAYQTLIGTSTHSPAHYVKIARLLARHKQFELAVQALSNISENQSMSPASQRSFVYWLGELKLWSAAMTKINSETYPKDMQRRLDYARYRYRDFTQDDDACQHYHIIAKASQHSTNARHIALALTERNARGAKGNSHREKISAAVRCVIYSSNPHAKVAIRINEPMDNIAQETKVSHQGGRIFTSPGIHEYMIKQPLPGKYTINYRCEEPTTLQLLFYHNFGNHRQSCEWVTIDAQPTKQFSELHQFEQTFKN